jgi:prolyl-tRNA synthetase
MSRTAGEDTLITCTSCSYSANSELATSRPPPAATSISLDNVTAIPFDSPSTNSLVAVILPSNRTVNDVKLAKHVADAKPIDSTQGSRELDSWDSLSIIVDESAAGLDAHDVHSLLTGMLASLISTSTSGDGTPSSTVPLETTPESVWPAPPSYVVADVRVVDPSLGDTCRKCASPLRATKAIEVGHTFVLGTKYSEALDARFFAADQKAVPFEMGCYGIGVSRLVAAIADKCVVDGGRGGGGIAWPPSVAPWKVAIVPVSSERTTAAAEAETPQRRDIRPLVDALVARGVAEDDIVFDDRPDLSFGRRIKDIELVGYPAVLVLGKQWQTEGLVEVQMRRAMDAGKEVTKRAVNVEEAADSVVANLRATSTAT